MSAGYSVGYSAGYSVGYSETGFIKPNPAWVYQNMAFAVCLRGARKKTLVVEY